MNPDYAFASVKFTDIVLYLFAFSGVIAVADLLGLLPPRMAKWLARNRLDVTLQALKRLGVRVSWDDQINSVGLVRRILAATNVKEPLYKAQLRAMLDEDTFKGEVHIGENRWFTSDHFIDVMGGSASSHRAAQYARLLNTHAHFVSLSDFDIVATPKTGSPLLGYEFARLTGKPLVLGTVRKLEGVNRELIEHSVLDFPRDLQLATKRVLLVDDSTTGGRKMLTLAEQLREFGATVDQALILFEPEGKGARALLQTHNIELFSVQAGPSGRF